MTEIMDEEEMLAPPPSETEPTTQEKIVDPRFAWYAVQVFSNMEKRVASLIEENTEKEGLGDHIQEVLVPVQEVTEIRRGKRIIAERKIFPGYVLIHMILTDATHQIIQQIQWTSSFLGNNREKPVPIPKKEIDRILSQMGSDSASVESLVSFEVGESVRVTEGPFDSFTGTVEEVDEERRRLKVAVSILGRITPVDIDYDQVEKQTY